MRTVTMILVLLSSFPSQLLGQIGILEGLFKNITDINAYGLVGSFTNRPDELAGSLDRGAARSSGLSGIGIETSFFMGGLGPLADKRDTIPPIDTLEIRSTRVDSVETKEVLVYKRKPQPKDYRWKMELGLGYTELRGFVSTVDSVDIRGAIRELPAVSLYVTYNRNSPFSFYGGLRTGLVQLQGFRAFVQKAGTTDETYSATGTTFQLGLVGGLIGDTGPVTIFVEPGYTHRRFPSLDWSNINGSVDDRLARSLDMSTFTIAIGAQIGIGDLSNSK
jgi:hypothetical protein